MVNYSQHLKLFLLLGLLALGLAQVEEHPDRSETRHRNKRTLTTICVEIKPSGPQEEPYFMCKGTDFSQPQQQQQQQPQQQQQQQPPTPNYAQPEASPIPLNGQYAQTPFPSFPSFGAGFFPIVSNYEQVAPTTSHPNQSPGGEYPSAGHFGSAAAAAAAPAAPAAQSYGVPAVSYPAAGGPAAAAHGTAAGAGAATPPHSYADAAAQKSPPAAQAAPLPKPPQPPSGQAGNGNPYGGLVGGRHRTGPDADVLAMPDVGFRHEELYQAYRRPEGILWMPTAAPQPQPQPQAQAPYSDDPIMRTFYASLEHNEPQVAQAAPMQQAAPLEPAPGYLPRYAPAPPPPAPPAPPAPSQPIYQANPRPIPAAPVDGSACNSCTRPCSASLESSPGYCPSFQPVIIAMPCYGQQQPTHYLAMPGPATASPAREPSSFGGPFGHLGSAFAGFNGPQIGSTLSMSPPPQVGSTFGMGPQVGGPFGLAPVLGPFGAFGTLNPFNPFNRMLGAAAPNPQQPRLRLFGAPEESTTPAVTTSPTAGTTLPAGPQFQQPAFNAFKLNFASSTLAPPSKVSSKPTNDPDGKQRDDDDDADNSDEDEDEDEDVVVGSPATDAPPTTGTTEDDDASIDAEVSKSLESKDQTADQLLKKGEDKIKSDKRKRFSSSNAQKRKYRQRLQGS